MSGRHAENGRLWADDIRVGDPDCPRSGVTEHASAARGAKHLIRWQIQANLMSHDGLPGNVRSDHREIVELPPVSVTRPVLSRSWRALLVKLVIFGCKALRFAVFVGPVRLVFHLLSPFTKQAGREAPTDAATRFTRGTR